MRIAALDIGDVRIGIAVSDPMEIIAQGVEVYTRGKDIAQDCRNIAKKLDMLQAERVVIGLPINMNGTRGPAVEKIESFAQELARFCPLEQVFWDERMTTAQAQRALISADVKRKKRKGVVDKIAAQLILQSYLDARGGSGN